MRQEGGGGAHVIDADQAARGCLRLRLVEQRVELGNARGGARRERSGRDRVDANALRAELGRDVADRAFERRLGDAHDVVVLHHHLAAVIGHREQRAALAHQRLGQMRHADEGPARHVHGGEKTLPRHVDDAPLQRLLGREGDRMHDEIELAPILGDALEHRLHLAGRAHVERHDDRRLELARERLDVFLRLVVEIGHRELGAERAERLGAAPGDRVFVGDADDQASLAFEQLGFDHRDHGRVPLALELVPSVAVSLPTRCLAGHVRRIGAVPEAGRGQS